MRHLPWTETERRDLRHIEAEESLDAYYNRKPCQAPGNPSLDPPPPPHPLPADSIAGMLKLCGIMRRRRNYSLIPNLSRANCKLRIANCERRPAP